MEMCRMCLSTPEDMVLMDEKFLIKYNIFTNLNITTEDKSLYSCRTCFDAATYCFEFREKCITSDQAFKDLIIDIPKFENDNKAIVVVKQETLEIVVEADDAELIDDCYNYGKDYLEHVVKKSERKLKKEPVVDTLPKSSYGICQTILKGSDELSGHLEHHTTDFAPAVCKESLISTPNMLGHQIKYLPKTQRRCHICSRKFISCENMEFYYMMVHEVPEKDAMIVCPKCLKPFPTVKQLQKHLSHHQELKFTCEHCSKKFHSTMEKKEADDSHEERKRRRQINDSSDDEKVEEERNRKNREKCKRYREKKKNRVTAVPISDPLDSDEKKREEERKQKNREKTRRCRQNKKKKNGIAVAALSMVTADSSGTKMEYARRKQINAEKSKRYRDKKRTLYLQTHNISNPKNVPQQIHRSRIASPSTRDVPNVPPLINTSQIGGSSTRYVPPVLHSSTTTVPSSKEAQAASPSKRDMPNVPPLIYTSQINGPSTRYVPPVLHSSTTTVPSSKDAQAASPSKRDIPNVPPLIYTSQISSPSPRYVPNVPRVLQSTTIAGASSRDGPYILGA